MDNNLFLNQPLQQLDNMQKFEEQQDTLTKNQGFKSPILDEKKDNLAMQTQNSEMTLNQKIQQELPPAVQEFDEAYKNSIMESNQQTPASTLNELKSNFPQMQEEKNENQAQEFEEINQAISELRALQSQASENNNAALINQYNNAINKIDAYLQNNNIAISPVGRERFQWVADAKAEIESEKERLEKG